MGIQQAMIRSLGDADAPPPPPILGLALTSGLYPVVVEGDKVDLGFGVGAQISLTIFFEPEAVNVAAQPGVPITLNTTLNIINYDDWPFEAVNVAAQPGVPITLVTTLNIINYDDWPLEALDLAAGPAPGNSITLVQTINYINNAMVPESVNLVANPGSITLV